MSSPFDFEGQQDSSSNPFLAPSSSAANSIGAISGAVLKSRAATVSLITSLLGIVFFPLSVVGVVSGHKALSRIRRSQGTVTGRSKAIAGLVIGYGGLLFAAVNLTAGFREIAERLNRPTAEDRLPVAAAQMKEAESSIISSSAGGFYGNCSEAIELAEEFSYKIKLVRDAVITEEKKGVSLSGHQFVTHCELHDGRCAFLVHVPSYRKFTNEAKEILAEAAWMTAQNVVADSLEEGDQLGVGLKGVFLYGAVMVGKVEEDGEKPWHGKDSDPLVSFFKPDAKKVPKPESESPDGENAVARAEEPGSESGQGEGGSSSSEGAAASGRSSLSVEPDIPDVPRKPTRPSTSDSEPLKTEVSSPSKPLGTSLPISEDLQLKFELVSEIRGIRLANNSLTFSPDGKRLALGRLDSRLLLFDVGSGEEVGGLDRLKSGSGVTTTAFTPDGKSLVAGCGDGSVQIFKIARDGRLSLQGKLAAHKQKVSCLCTSPDSRFAISGGRDKQVVYCSLEESRVVERFGAETFENAILTAVFSPDGTKVLACDGPNLVMISLASHQVIPRDLNMRIPVGVLSPDGRRFAGRGAEEMYVWRTATGELLPRSIPTERRQSKCFTFTHDAKRLLIGGRSEVKVWAPETCTLLGVLTTDDRRFMIKALAMSPDGQFVAVVCDIGSSVRVYRISDIE